MARPRRPLVVSQPAIPADPVALHVAIQAHEAVAAGMGMTAFFAWACSYTIGRFGMSEQDAERIILPAWEDAWGQHRDSEIARMQECVS